MDPVKFRGVITLQRYYNEDSFFGVFMAQTKEALPYAKEVNQPNIFEDDEGFEPHYVVCVAGKMQQLYVGSEYEFVATCEFNTKYNEWNYVPNSIIAIAPSSEADMRFFLQSIITEKQTNVLLKEYPNIVQDIIDGKDNVDVRKLRGIGDSTYKDIRRKIIDNYVISDIISLLQPYGVTYTAIKNLLKWEHNSAILKQKIKQNPYCLTAARGFGFTTVDKIALRMDPELICSGKRLVAFMKYYLENISENDGHTWIYLDNMKTGIADQIPQCIDVFNQFIDVKENGEFGGYFYIEDDKIGLAKYHRCEKYIYEILQDIDSYKYSYIIDTDKGIAKAEEDLGYALSEEQKDVVRQIEKSNVVIFTGAAGTGKSTIGRAILNSLCGAVIGCCSLSAKAAQRIQEATGHEAMTIHRLLGYNGGSFEFDSNNRLDYDVIFLDEASMVNCTLFYYLISAIKEGSKLIICGDYAQLPPIGAGNIFFDILHMKDKFNVSILKKVHRQAEKSGILSDANNIRRGRCPIEKPQPQILTGELKDMAYVFRDNNERIQDIVVNQYIKIANKYGVDNVAVATPRKDTVTNSSLEINKRIQSQIIDTDNTKFIKSIYNKFYVGDKILQIENDGKRDIYNGEIGYVVQVNPNAKPNESCMIAKFKSTINGSDKIIRYTWEDMSSVLLGYAMSIHKLQGSEYDYVIIAIDTTHYILLDCCMLYTAITRAKKMCILAAQPEAFNKALRTNKINSRQTWLNLIYNNKGC